MSLVVWKFPVPVVDTFTLTMPAEAQMLGVQLQSGEPFLWAMVDPDQIAGPRVFHVVGTGRPIPNSDAAVHVGTWQAPPFVWHLFEDCR